MAGQLPVGPNSDKYPFSDQDMSVIYYYDAVPNVEYIAKARPGTLSSETGWQIRKFTYNLVPDVTHVKFADGSNLYNKIADDHASYVYS